MGTRSSHILRLASRQSGGIGAVDMCARLSTGCGRSERIVGRSAQNGVMTEATGSPKTASAPLWEQRFRAPRVSLPDWAEDAPDRALFVSNATGTYELYTWD